MVDLIGKKITDLELENLTQDMLSSTFIPVASGSSTKRIALTQVIARLNENLRQTTNGFIGQILSGIRTDTPSGYLQLDGVRYDSASLLYPELKKAFLDNKIPYMTNKADWDALCDPDNTATSGNCGLFFFDVNNDYFCTPKLDNRVFIANGTDLGKYGRDEIVNITSPYDKNGNLVNTGDRLGRVNGPVDIDTTRPTALDFVYGYENAPEHNSGRWGTYNLTLDASRQVNTGDRVQPRHIQYPYFVCVSTVEAGIDPTIYAKTIELQSEMQTRARAIIDLQTNINQLQSQIDGKQQGRVFNTKEELDNFISNPYNTQNLPIGFNFLILAQSSPNYIWDGTAIRPVPRRELNLNNYYTKTDTDNLLNSKVNLIAGYGLSKNSYSDAEKAKLALAITQSQLDSEVKALTDLINQKLDIGIIRTIISDKASNDETIPTTLAVKNYVNTNVGTKADKMISFTKNFTWQILTQGNALDGLFLDLSSFIAGDSDGSITAEVYQDEDSNNINQTIEYSSGYNSLSYIKQVNADTPEETLLWKNGEIIPSDDIQDGVYFSLNKFVVNDVVRDATIDLQIGTYEETDLKKLNERINFLENSITDDGSVDFKETAQSIYHIASVNVINGGTGYVTGDVIYANASLIEGDRRGVMVVGSANLSGVIQSVIVNNQGVYFNDIAGQYDIVGGTGSGAIIEIETSSETGTTLASKSAVQNHRVNVLYDETSDYNGYYYIYNAEDQEWQKNSESHLEERDFQIDKIKNYEIEDGAISTAKIIDKNVSKAKIEDVLMSTITEDNTKYGETENFTFAGFLQSIKNKVNGLFTNKQDALSSGTNIKTINNVSLLGSGNIEAGGILDGTGFVKASGTTISYDNTSYVPTTRTVNSKALSANIALTNSDIGLGSVTNDKQLKDADKTTSISSTSTDTQIPSAKAVYTGLSGKQNSLSRTVQTNLASTSSATDTGGNLTPGVTGILPMANGGTGSTSADGALDNLGAFGKTDVVKITNPYSGSGLSALTPNAVNTLPDGRKVYFLTYNGAGTCGMEVTMTTASYIYKIEGYFKAATAGMGSCIGYPDSGGFTCDFSNVFNNSFKVNMSGNAGSSAYIRAWIWCV